jgi:hypothetical protein
VCWRAACGPPLAVCVACGRSILACVRQGCGALTVPVGISNCIQQQNLLTRRESVSAYLLQAWTVLGHAAVATAGVINLHLQHHPVAVC